MLIDIDIWVCRASVEKPNLGARRLLTLHPYYSVPVVTVKLATHLDDFRAGDKIRVIVVRQGEAGMSFVIPFLLLARQVLKHRRFCRISHLSCSYITDIVSFF